VSAQIVYELAIVVGTKVAGLEGVGIAAAVAVAVDCRKRYLRPPVSATNP